MRLVETTNRRAIARYVRGSRYFAMRTARNTPSISTIRFPHLATLMAGS